jgi:hypothetical protein
MRVFPGCERSWREAGHFAGWMQHPANSITLLPDGKDDAIRSEGKWKHPGHADVPRARPALCCARSKSPCLSRACLREPLRAMRMAHTPAHIRDISVKSDCLLAASRSCYHPEHRLLQTPSWCSLCLCQSDLLLLPPYDASSKP